MGLMGLLLNLLCNWLDFLGGGCVGRSCWYSFKIVYIDTYGFAVTMFFRAPQKSLLGIAYLYLHIMWLSSIWRSQSSSTSISFWGTPSLCLNVSTYMYVSLYQIVSNHGYIPIRRYGLCLAVPTTLIGQAETCPTDPLDQRLPTKTWKLNYAFSNFNNDMIGQMRG